MALDIIKTAETIHALEVFMDKRRPPENIRHEIDLDYKIENQSIIIFEVRPHWHKKDEKIESPIAKTTWVKTQKCWKIFWMRADLKWHSYQPAAVVETIEEFLKVVDKDAHGCFWG
jgi:hypothetical protein